MCLSSGYDIEKYRPILETYGLKTMSMNRILRTVRQDLESPSSVMKSKSPEGDYEWHSKAALLISIPFQTQSPEMGVAKLLNLIPTRDGRWVSTLEETVYYPTVGNGVQIPLGLELTILHPDAAKNADRCKLFDYLGVRHGDAAVLRKLLFDKHRRAKRMNLDLVRDHLRFLYLTHESASHDEKPSVYVIDHVGNLKRAPDNDIYLLDDHPYGAGKLLQSPEEAKSVLKISFLSQTHFENVPEKPAGMSLSWEGWLHSFLRVRRHIPLVGRETSELSPECKWIAQHHEKDFLGFLTHVWGKERSAVIENRLVEALRETLVLCRGGKKMELGSAYLPLARLEESQRRFMDDEYFPFVQLPPNSSETPPWAGDLGVRREDDHNFRLDMLKYIKKANPTAGSIQRAARLPDLYQYIYGSCIESRDRQALASSIR